MIPRMKSVGRFSSSFMACKFNLQQIVTSSDSVVIVIHRVSAEYCLLSVSSIMKDNAAYLETVTQFPGYMADKKFVKLKYIYF